jgi:hypothetical protein
VNALKDYTFEVASVASDKDRIVAIWRRGFSRAGDPEAKFDWYYARNPAGEPLVVLLCHGAQRKAVGTASTGRRLLQTGDRTALAGVLLDFVVDAGHRTLFPAMALQREMKRAADYTFGTIYGFPNPHSEAAIRRQGFEQKAMLVRHVLVLRSAPYLARWMPANLAKLAGPIADALLRAPRAIRASPMTGMRTGWSERPDGRFDELWSRCAGVAEVVGVRDSAFLAWRLADFPFGRHEFFTLSSADDGKLQAYAAGQVVGNALHVSDFLADPGESRLLLALWHEITKAAYARGHASISIEFCGDDSVHRTLASAGFRVRSERPFYVSRSSPLIGKRWYVTAADEDS